jgi:hypothetical protein
LHLEQVDIVDDIAIIIIIKILLQTTSQYNIILRHDCIALFIEIVSMSLDQGMASQFYAFPTYQFLIMIIYEYAP